MIAALSPVQSWLVFGALILGAVILYIVLVGRDWFSRADRVSDAWLERWHRENGRKP